MLFLLFKVNIFFVLFQFILTKSNHIRGVGKQTYSKYACCRQLNINITQERQNTNYVVKWFVKIFGIVIQIHQLNYWHAEFGQISV